MGTQLCEREGANGRRVGRERGGMDQRVEPAHQVPVVGDAQGALGSQQGDPQGRQLLNGSVNALLIDHLRCSDMSWSCAAPLNQNDRRC